LTGTGLSNGNHVLVLFDSHDKTVFTGSFIVPWYESGLWHDAEYRTCANPREGRKHMTIGVIYVPPSDEYPAGGEQLLWMKCEGLVRTGHPAQGKAG
jgi:hypothetical protein